MSKKLIALGFIAFLAGCGGGGDGVSRAALDNACTLVKQNPDYLRAFRKTERKWGVPVQVQMATIYQESKFVSNARTPLKFAAGVIPIGRQSSAYGYSQALDGTWDEYQRETGKRSAKRNRIQDATDFMGWYMTKTRARNGIPLSDARNQYLAYHEGHSGYARGSYRSKSWLMRVANEVGQRSRMYEKQLSSCKTRR